MPQENKEGTGAAGSEKTLEKPDAGAAAAADDANKGGKADDGDDKGDDEEITVKKSEYEGIKKKASDFETALKIANQKGGKKEITPDSKEKDGGDTSQFVTKKDLYKTNEKKAIGLATSISKDDSEEIKAIKKDLDDHWDDIKLHYTGKSGKETPEDIIEDLYDAHAVWKRRNVGKSDSSDKDVKAALSQERGTGGKGKDSYSEKRRRILPLNTDVKDWYKKKA